MLFCRYIAAAKELVAFARGMRRSDRRDVWLLKGTTDYASHDDITCFVIPLCKDPQSYIYDRHTVPDYELTAESPNITSNTTSKSDIISPCSDNEMDSKSSQNTSMRDTDVKQQAELAAVQSAAVENSTGEKDSADSAVVENAAIKQTAESSVTENSSGSTIVATAAVEKSAESSVAVNASENENETAELTVVENAAVEQTAESTIAEGTAELIVVASTTKEQTAQSNVTEGAGDKDTADSTIVESADVKQTAEFTVAEGAAESAVVESAVVEESAQLIIVADAGERETLDSTVVESAAVEQPAESTIAKGSAESTVVESAAVEQTAQFTVTEGDDRCLESATVDRGAGVAQSAESAENECAAQSVDNCECSTSVISTNLCVDLIHEPIDQSPPDVTNNVTKLESSTISDSDEDLASNDSYLSHNVLQSQSHTIEYSSNNENRSTDVITIATPDTTVVKDNSDGGNSS